MREVKKSKFIVYDDVFGKDWMQLSQIMYNIWGKFTAVFKRDIEAINISECVRVNKLYSRWYTLVEKLILDVIICMDGGEIVSFINLSITQSPKTASTT